MGDSGRPCSFEIQRVDFRNLFLVNKLGEFAKVTLNRNKNSMNSICRFATLLLTLNLTFSQVPAYPMPLVTLLPTIKQGGRHFSIPPEMGSIEETYLGKTSKTIIYIQDAHDSLEAQGNIAGMIHHLVQHDDVKTVFEEGCDGSVPTDKYFGDIPEVEVKKKVAFFLMDKLRLGGAEYAHIIRDQDFKLIGTENLKLYLSNIAAYSAVAAVNKRTERDLKALQIPIERLGDRYFPKEIKEWLKTQRRLEAGEMDLLEYVRRLTAWFGEIRVKEYPILYALIKSQRAEAKKILASTTESQVKDLFLQIEQIENTLAARYLTEPRSQKIFEIYKDLKLIRGLNSFEMTPEKFNQAKIKLKNFKTKSVAKFITKNENRSIVVSKYWETVIANAVQFYDLARERDQTLDRRLRGFLDNTEEQTAILVFGGFHKPKITEWLKKRGVSYIVVSPKIKRISPRHRQYYKQLMAEGGTNLEVSRGDAKATKPLSVLVAAEQSSARQIKIKRGIARLAAEVRKLHSSSLRMESAWNETMNETEFTLKRSELRVSENISRVPVVLLVGKPGSGKTFLGRKISELLGPTVLHMSMGDFIRKHTHYETPLTPEQRKDTYRILGEYLKTKPFISLLIFDNNPYGDDSYAALSDFFEDRELDLKKVIEIDAADEIVLARMDKRGRSNTGSHNNDQRIRYYNQSVPEQIKKFNSQLVVSIQNNRDADLMPLHELEAQLKDIPFIQARAFIQRLANRLNHRLGLNISDSKINEHALELIRLDLFEYAIQAQIGEFHEYSGSSIDLLLKQEAKLYIYAEPSFGKESQVIQAQASWNSETADVMKNKREVFYHQQETPAFQEKYWEQELLALKGDVAVFHQNPGDGAVEISVVILVLANRVVALPQRLKELDDSLPKGSFEVNIVLADPHHLDLSDREDMKRNIDGFAFPIKIIESKRGRSISTNRNLGSSESKGEFLFFLDDDVRLSKNTIPLMVETLKQNSEIGVTQAVTYDGHTGVLDRPKPWFAKRFYSPEVAVTNIAVGMVMGTRAEIVRAVPFASFWPNFGEDVFFGTQVMDLGFYLSFVYGEDAFVIHDHVTKESATRSDAVFKNAWIHHTLSYYLNPVYYEDLGQIEFVLRINKTTPEDPEEMLATFQILRLKVAEFLEDKINQAEFEDVAWSVNKKSITVDQLKQIIEYFIANKKEILEFKNARGSPSTALPPTLSVDTQIDVNFPSRETAYGVSKGFSQRVNSTRSAEIVLFKILNAMRNNGGPSAVIHARGTARAYLERALVLNAQKIEKTRAALDDYYGQGAFEIIFSAEEAGFNKVKETAGSTLSPLTEAEGIYLGVDVGGKSIKLTALIAGEAYVIGSFPGDSYAKTLSEDHIDFVAQSVLLAIQDLSVHIGKSPDEIKTAIRGIGISWNAPVNDGKLIAHYDELSPKESTRIKDILEELVHRFRTGINSDVQVSLKNDGFSGALGGLYLSRNDPDQGGVAYLGLGTGVAFGFFNPTNTAQTGMFEIHKMTVGYEDGEPYAAGDKLSFKAFAERMGLPPNTKAERIRKIILSAGDGSVPAQEAASEMGGELAKTIDEILKYWPVKKVFVGGGFLTGDFGNILLKNTKIALANDDVRLLRFDEPLRGYESSIGIAYYAALVRNELGDKEIIQSFLRAEISKDRNIYQDGVNVHEEYKTAESAIVREQKRLEKRMDELLAKAQEGGEQSDSLLVQFRGVMAELSGVIAARKKFIALGVPVFHSHTNLEDDGILSPQELVQTALKNNVTILYVTGHNRMAGSLKATEYIKSKDIILEIFPGVEIDTPTLDADGIVHFVVIGPHDSSKVSAMKKIGDDAFDAMQANFRWRVNRMLQLANDEEFEKAWNQVISKHADSSQKLRGLIEILIKKKVMTDPMDTQGLRQNLLRWFKDVQEYVNEKGIKKEFYNKLDVLGNWTDPLESWPNTENPRWQLGTAGSRRKALRGFFDMLYSDTEIETLSGAKMRRAEDILGAFSKLGARITLAHPEFELHVIREISAERHPEFWQAMSRLIDKGSLHAIGAGWSREGRVKIENAVKQLRIQLKRDENTLPLVLNIPDYHGEDKTDKDIRKGLYQRTAEGGYYVWEDVEAHDTDNFYRDADYLARPYLDDGLRLLKESHLEMALVKIIEAYKTNPYVVDEIQKILSRRSEVRRFVSKPYPEAIFNSSLDLDLWVRSLRHDFMVTMRSQDYASLEDSQREEYDLILRQNERIDLVLYANEQGELSEKIQQHLARLKKDLGANRIVVIPGTIGHALQVHGRLGKKMIHFTKIKRDETYHELLKNVPVLLRKDFYAWRYLRGEPGALLAAVRLAEDSENRAWGKVMDLDSIDSLSKQVIQVYLSSLVFSAAA